jgi:TrmH family RNA methyltransferase
MSGVAVAVVDAETPGNVGTVARAMKNFGFADLLLVDPPDLDPDGEAYGFAGRAREDVLPGARELAFEELVAGYHTIACAAVPNEDASSHVRYPVVTPAELPERLGGLDGDVAIVFGRERIGLTNEELAALDEICSIPASPRYPSLNLGQAATIVMYELRSIGLESTQLPDDPHELAGAHEVERLHDMFEEFVAAIGHPEPKRAKAARMFRRLVGRADPTPREASTLTGIFRRGARLAENDTADEGF